MMINPCKMNIAKLDVIKESYTNITVKTRIKTHTMTFPRTELSLLFQQSKRKVKVVLKN